MFQNKKLSKLHHKSFIILGVLFLSLLSVLVLSQPTNAYTKIKKSQIKLIADFTLQYRANAGGTITKDYYVFPDTKGVHGGKGSLLKVVSRSSCKQTSSVKLSTSYLSGIYHKWGTSKVALIAMGKQNGCYSISGGKLKKSSGCTTPPGRNLTYQGTAQGTTATMNGYVFKVAGYTGGIIGVWTSGGKRVATYQIPKSVVNAEPENIAVDGSTGEVYINYAKKKNGKRHSLWYKINSSVFSKYTGKKGSSNPTICKNNTSSGTSSSSDSSHDIIPYDPTADGLIIRDETYKQEIAQSTYDGIVETEFFGSVKDEDGCGVYTTLSFILDILSIGIGIAAIMGIVIAGTTYLSSKGDVAKTTKAKRRIYEIVIGLVAYAVLYALLAFLVPEFNPELKVCKALTPEEIAQIKAEKKAENEAKIKEAEEKRKAERAARQNSVKSKTDSNAEKRKMISEVGTALAWSSTSKPYKKKATAAFNKAMKAVNSNKGESGCRKKGQACGMFVGTVVRYSGVDKNMPTMACKIYDYVRGKGKYKNKGGDKKWQEVKNKKQAQPGDIALKIINGKGRHVAMYVKNSKGKTVTAEGSLCKYYGVIKSKKQYTTQSNYKVYRYVGE